VVRGLTPPIVLAAAKRTRGWITRDPRHLAGWKHLARGWRSSEEANGWNVGSVADAYAKRWPALLEALKGAAPLGVSLEVPESCGGQIATDDLDAHNTLMSYGYVLGRAAHNKSRISILDWGGGPGHYYLIGRALLPEVEFDYLCKEVPEVCARGRELLPQVTFAEDESCLKRRYDLVLASSSLQYVEDWQALAGALALAAGSYLYLARVSVVEATDQFAVLQRAHSYGYETSYVCWVLNRDELVACVEGSGMRLVREFLSAPEIPVSATSEAVKTGGFLFKSQA
jgi:putative methyltransferase (TIGR04325 family)